MVYICALFFVIASMILIWSDFWDFPPPYQKALQIAAESNGTTVSVAERPQSLSPFAKEKVAGDDGDKFSAVT